MRTSIIQGSFAIIAGLALTIASTSQSPAQSSNGTIQAAPVTELPVIGGSFYSMQRNQPPLPFNPFPDLPLYDVGGGRFAFDDRQVDYVQVNAEIRAAQAAMESEMALDVGAASLEAEGEGGGSMSMLMSGNEVRLKIEFTGDDGRRISFNSHPGLVYQIQQSTNLINWTLLDTWVANDTNKAYYAFDPGKRFYRVIEGSDLIQFPDFFPVVNQSSFIDVYTTLQGTANVKIFADGVLWYEVQGSVPGSGSFRVSDGLYNPNNWPNDGYYNIANWEYRVTIVSTVAGAGGAASTTQTNQGIVFKKGRTRTVNHIGITVQQYGALGQVTPAVEDQLDEFMRLYFLANLQSSQQVDLGGALLGEATDPTPRLFDAQDRARLRLLMFGSNGIPHMIDRLHYFGHGTNTSFSGIRITEARTNVFCTEPFTFIALDGCKTAATTDMLGEYTCYWKPVTRNDMIELGLTPGFGCGWSLAKNAAWYPTQGALVLNHYHFWIDFYGLDGGLTHRDPLGQYMDKTYDDAYRFAKDPGGNGINPGLQSNPEAGGFVRVGCLDCFFDL